MAKRAALIFAVALLVAVAVATLFFRSDEPRYQGRSLSQWIRANSQNPGDPQVREAIVIITTNSVPVLIRWLSRDTSLEESLEAKLPAFMRQNTLVSRFLYRDRYRAACSVRAFQISGTNATCAIPELAQLLADHNPFTVKLHAMLALPFIGPAALPSLRQAVTSRDRFVRGLAVEGLRRLGTNAAPAIPDLIAALSDPDSSARRQATNALLEIAPGSLTNTPAQ